jgi:divalent metal cation (Fe/Co/Zn/Cd) transporter
MEVNLELMDGSQSQAQYRDIFQAVKSVPGVARPHRARMRRIASQWDIDLDIEVDGKMTVNQAHKLATDVENAIKARIDNVYDIMVHVEPCGAHEESDANEAFGLSESSLK